MKLTRTNFPFRHEEKKEQSEKEVNDAISKFSEQDYSEVENLIKNNEIEKLKELINNRMTPYEEAAADGQAGLPTRDYLTSLFGHAIFKKHPEFKNHSAAYGSQLKDIVQDFKNKFYPGLDKALAAHRMSTNVEASPWLDGSEYGGRNGLKWKVRKNEALGIGTLAHELGHATDFLSEKAAYLEDPEDIASSKKILSELIKQKPAYHSLLSGEVGHNRNNTESEKGYNNYRTPNFSDYDYQKGDFNSDYMQSPSDIQDRTGRDHHTGGSKGRNYPYDNLINMVEGGADKVVESTPKFSKLKKILT